MWNLVRFSLRRTCQSLGVRNDKKQRINLRREGYFVIMVHQTLQHVGCTEDEAKKLENEAVMRSTYEFNKMIGGHLLK